LISTSGSDGGIGYSLLLARTVRIARHPDTVASYGSSRLVWTRITAPQLRERAGDHGHDRYGDHCPGDAGQHPAHREREDDRERMEPYHPADHLRLEQMGFKLVLDDQDP
jgi:hypothetical protein